MPLTVIDKRFGARAVAPGSTTITRDKEIRRFGGGLQSSYKPPESFGPPPGLLFSCDPVLAILQSPQAKHDAADGDQQEVRRPSRRARVNHDHKR
jgi:hypothetical protein